MSSGLCVAVSGSDERQIGDNYVDIRRRRGCMSNNLGKDDLRARRLLSLARIHRRVAPGVGSGVTHGEMGRGPDGVELIELRQVFR